MDQPDVIDPPQLDADNPGHYGALDHEGTPYVTLWRYLATLSGTAVIPSETVNGSGV